MPMRRASGEEDGGQLDSDLVRQSPQKEQQWGALTEQTDMDMPLLVSPGVPVGVQLLVTHSAGVGSCQERNSPNFVPSL